MTIERLGDLSAVTRQPRRAAKLFGAAMALRKRRNAPGDLDEQCQRQDSIRFTREQLDETTFAVAWEEGETMPIEQAIVLALETQR